MVGEGRNGTLRKPASLARAMCDVGGLDLTPSVSREQLERHRRGLGPRRGQRFDGQPQVDEDLLRDVLLLDSGDDPHQTSTMRVSEHVSGEEPLQERGPIETIA
jgi:hypothetical protein